MKIARVLLVIFVGLLAVTLIVVVAGLGFYAYNVGLGQGLAESGKIVAPDGARPSAGAAPYTYGPGFYRPFFGFGVFSCFVPILFLFLFFGLLRQRRDLQPHASGHVEGFAGSQDGRCGGHRRRGCRQRESRLFATIRMGCETN